MEQSSKYKEARNNVTDTRITNTRKITQVHDPITWVQKFPNHNKMQKTNVKIAYPQILTPTLKRKWHNTLSEP